VVLDQVTDQPDVTGRVGLGHEFAGQPFVFLGHRGLADRHVDVAPDVDLANLAGAAAREELPHLARIADGRRKPDPLERAGEVPESLEADR